MADKKSKASRQAGYIEANAKRRTRTLQFIFVAFSVILILSMVLSLVSK